MNIDPTQSDRQRRYRARQNSGATYAAGDIPSDLAIVLIEQGFLSDVTAMDAKARFDALVAYANHARTNLKKFRDGVVSARSM